MHVDRNSDQWRYMNVLILPLPLKIWCDLQHWLWQSGGWCSLPTVGIQLQQSQVCTVWLWSHPPHPPPVPPILTPHLSPCPPCPLPCTPTVLPSVLPYPPHWSPTCPTLLFYHLPHTSHVALTCMYYILFRRRNIKCGVCMHICKTISPHWLAIDFIHWLQILKCVCIKTACNGTESSFLDCIYNRSLGAVCSSGEGVHVTCLISLSPDDRGPDGRGGGNTDKGAVHSLFNEKSNSSLYVNLYSPKYIWHVGPVSCTVVCPLVL